MRSTIKTTMVAASVAGALLASSANAAEFYFGEDEDIVLQINSQLSVGASWRLRDPSPRLIGVPNGGEGFSNAADDSTQNFHKNETFSKIIKGVHDIQLSKDNWGFFTRVKYWYDKELKDEGRHHGHGPNGYAAGEPLNDDNFSDFAKFSGFEIMDAYFYSNFDMGEVPVDFRLGRQVVSWGESTFIQGGLNSTNPFDVSALRRPGASLKEGLLPVGMAYVNAGVTDNLSIEAFYQYEWEKTLVDGCGTLFSAVDFAADGCEYVTIGPGDATAVAAGYYAARKADGEPDDGGQYGLAARYVIPEWNDTEIGFYYMNIHSRLPLINSTRTAIPTAGVDSVFIPSSLDPTGGSLAALNPGYRLVFPEDLKYYGFSFASNLGGVAVSGEISYKPDTPVQINGPEILNATLSEQPFFRFTPRVQAVGYGEDVQGWDQFDVTQMQVTAIQFFDQVLGASRLSLIAEAGAVFTDGVEDSDQLYGRNTIFGLGDFDSGIPHPSGSTINCSLLKAAGQINADCRDDGFTTDSAWGYRLRASLDYPNVIGGVSLKPTFDWQHDVSGYSPDPGQQFHEGRKTVGVSLEASYQQKYTATLGFKSFSGGSHNVAEDKDFVSLSLGVSY